jgi:hypothetical protein
MNNELINIAMFEKGRADALGLQSHADELSANELYVKSDIMPSFAKACEVMNMLERPIGFTCKSSAGRVVRLL